MVARRPSLLAAGAMVCAALSLWVSFGALSFVDAENHAPYVGVLPTLQWLGLLLVAALALTIAVRPSSAAVAPLWLSAAALLPWLPLPMPLSTLIWSGNLLVWLWAAIAIAVSAPAISRLARQRGWLEMPPQRSAIAAGLIAAAAYGLAAWSTAPVRPNGDEPHYLFIAQSLVRDHDLKVENNHKAGDDESHLGRSVPIHFLNRGKDGEIYSLHAPGLPLVVAPGYALFGYRGAVAELVLIAAAAGALVWLIAFRVTGDAAASWFGWAAVTMSAPFFFHSAAMFPDGLAAALTVVALLPLVDPRARNPPTLAAVGAALALLPWLHTRYAILAVSAALAIAGRCVAEDTRRARRVAAFAAFPAASAAAWLLFFHVIYGAPNPFVAFDPSNSLAWGNLVRGVPGHAADQQYGLITNAPVFLCSLAGIVTMLRRRHRRLAIELLVITVPYLIVVCLFDQWWGGTTPPARFLVPVTLMLAVPSAAWWATTRRVEIRVPSATALLISLLITATMASAGSGWLVFNDRDGLSRIAVWLSGVVDLTRALPSLFQNPPGTAALHAVVWLAAIASAVATGALLGRRGRTAALLGFGAALQVAAMVAVSVVWRSNSSAVPTPSTSGTAVLSRWNSGDDRIAFGYRPFRRLERNELPGAIVLARAMTGGARVERTTLPHAPAGVYELTGRVVGPARGRVQIRTDRVSGPIAAWEVASLESNWMRQVAIPVAVAGLQIEVDADARKAVRDVSIRSVSLQSLAETLETREARRAARFGSSLVFWLTGEAWVEPGGAWIAGRSEAEFAIATVPHSPLQVLVRNGPVENQVTLTSAAWQETLQLNAGDERVVQVPPGVNSRLTPLTVAASSGFRPSDVDAGSDDRRLLGVWIETR
jgi:hypothetical protein